MKSIVAIGMTVLALAAGARAQAPAGNRAGAEGREVLRLVQEWMDAEVRGDMAFLDGFIADDWLSTDPSGAVWTKTQFLAGLKSGEGAVVSAALDDMTVRVYGDAAVVTGRMTSTMRFQGRDISGRYQCTDMFVRQAGRWRCVATHLSALAQ